VENRLNNYRKTLSESPIVTFVRGLTLLAFLIVLPGIAVCWNHLPKDIWGESMPSPAISNIENAQHFEKDFNETSQSMSVFVPESSNPVLPVDSELQAVRTTTAIQAAGIPIQEQQISPNAVTRQVSWEHPRPESPQNFESLVLHLQALGAKSYRLEKWGNRGELFRFSCLVAPSNAHTYEKHFQFIGSDAVAVIKTVIADIEQWKNAP